VRCCAYLEGLRRRRKSVFCRKFSDQILIECCADAKFDKLVVIIYCLLTRVKLVQS
jgi:hypothetical protein